MARIFTTEDKNNVISFPGTNKLEEKIQNMESAIQQFNEQGITNISLCITIIKLLQSDFSNNPVIYDNLDLVLYILRTRLESKS